MNKRKEGEEFFFLPSAKVDPEDTLEQLVR